ncbi:hypothetical protein FSP39_013912 [Pinctada imbricata]|uniref:sn-1-specific diacylglycerol lipase n=1 Tax=Pinctada imbricata TaxID=66713 RepID=A0AA88XS48_PINIB|nr:hypothetical protein FSP39_013912 [Pinctada imbricata]
MPALTAFGRRWSVGTDDFVFPGLLEIFVRVVWLIAISIVYNYHGSTVWDCNGGGFLKGYYIGLLLLLCICIVLSAVIVFISMKGSITNVGPREKLVLFLYIKIAISVPELIWNILGTYWSFSESKECQRSVVWTARGAVISGWILAVIVIIGVIVVFDPLGKQSRKDCNTTRLQSDPTAQVTDSAMVASRKAWEKRLRFLCCCLICDDQSKDAFKDISKLLTEFFKGPYLVPTDVAAGLILVQNLQESLVGGAQYDKSYATFSPNTHEAISSSSSGLACQNGRPKSNSRPTEPQPWMTMDLITHYMKFALGSYGWPLYVFDNLLTGVCRLCGACRCFACMKASPNIIHDNCCMCNTAAIRKYTELPTEDIEYVNYHNEVYEIPFYIAIDRKYQAVVVSVRGTLSFKDVLTDMTADCDTIEMSSCDRDSKVHKGMLQAAEYIKSKLEENDRLQFAFQKAQGSRLVITGHSLGAGTAALLSILLKPDYPDLICFAFSPPGGLLSYNASVHCKEYVCSVVLGKDIIPRLGLTSMEDLKFKVYRAIRDTNLPKYRILAGGVWQLICGCFDDNSGLSNRMLNGENLIHDSRSMVIRERLEESIQESILKMQQFKDGNTQLYPPGQVLHIQEVDRERRCFETPSYYAEWKEVDEFGTILVGPDMFSDHLPNNVFDALDQLSKKNFTPRKYRTSQNREAITDV